MPKTGSPPRSMKAANAPMKKYMAPKNNFIDVYVTAVPEISIAIAIKDTSPPGPSFLFNHFRKFNDDNHYASLSDKQGITAFMDGTMPVGDDVMKYSSQESHYPWNTIITLHLTEIENHAEVGNCQRIHQILFDEKHNCPEKFVFRDVHYADVPKPFYYHMDKDCVPMLKRMYGGEDGSTKQDLMEYESLLTIFFGCEEEGKEVLEAVDNYTWDILDL